MRITAHCLVKNEENFIWYALNSVIEHVERIIVWDTGSNDNTVAIIKSIKNEKIDFEEKGPVDPKGVTRLRQEMLDKTDADWIFIVDGDEIWWEEGVTEIISLIREHGDSKDLIANPTKMLVGDIFHYQEEEAGYYKIAGRTGHFNIRAIRREIRGLHVEGIYPDEAYVDRDNVKIQDFPEERIIFSKVPYLHASHLVRSRLSKSKFKYELGKSFPKDFYYPEVFFRPRPDIVPSPWQTMSSGYKLNAFWQIPLKKIKRRII